MPFPSTRLRRLRSTPAIRAMFQETDLSARHLIAPLFVREGITKVRPIASMPGQNQYSLNALLKEAESLLKAGINGVLLFGVPSSKDAIGSQAWAEEGIVQQAVRSLKKRFPALFVMTDLCFCEYTDHGHCGVLRAKHLDNDATLANLARGALAQAAAGADLIAPSGMIDGMIGAIRKALDRGGYSGLPIMSYAAKYASAFYGPFREAAGSTPQFGDRRSYQMNPANAREALREVASDIEEGADIVMVKPALAYIDILSKVKERFHVPTAAYNVSGEYSMVKAAALRGWIDERAVVTEILTGLRRAGADVILTYHAKDWATWHKR